MSNAMKASQDLKMMASKFKAIVEISDTLERIGSLEQAERDATIRKNEAYQSANQAEAELLAKREEIKAAELVIEKKKEAIAALEGEESAHTASLIEAAEMRAQEIVAKAEARKLEIFKKSKEMSDATEAMQKDLSAKTKELKFIQSQLKTAKQNIFSFGVEG